MPINNEDGKHFESFREQTYRNLQTNNLILYGIYSVISKGEECTFERLVKECFTLFPKVFGFERYNQWPDSLRFDRPLRTLRQKGLVVGSPKTVFSFTKFGEQLAKSAEKSLKSGQVTKSHSQGSPRGADASLVAFLKESEVFKQFLRNKREFSISEMQLRNLLRCTLETPSRVVKQNLQYSKHLAEEYSEGELLEFLTLCEQGLGKGGEHCGT